MGQVFKGQTKLRITLDLKEDITGQSKVYVKYIKPDSSSGQFTAKVENASTGIIYYDVQKPGDIDQDGNWKFWGYVVFTDGKVIAGETQVVKILEEGSQN